MNKSPLGQHVILDFWGCSFDSLDDLALIRKMFDDALAASNASVIEIVMHKFSPQGVTGVAAIAESHVSIHTWPELGFAAIDVFSCGVTMNVENLISHFETILQPTDVDRQTLSRGRSLRLAKTR